jgi:O-acetyl-ADP-ribose deacetylase (regulator of RNase III)
MIEFCNGNLFDSGCEALVNTVNCKGVMGCGIALQFKNKYPEMFVDYKNFCGADKLRPGKLHIFGTKPVIINFPTKIDWRNVSKYSWIEVGLARLFGHTIPNLNIKSIAMPALGCNNGKLNWSQIKLLIQKWYYVFDDILKYIDIKVYEPYGKH